MTPADGRPSLRLILDTPSMRELTVAERQYQAVSAVIDAVGHQFDEHVTASARTTPVVSTAPNAEAVARLHNPPSTRCVRESRAIRVKCVAAVPSHGAGVRS